MNINEIKKYLENFAEEKNLEGMARFGINPKNGIGVGMTYIRELQKKIKKDDELSDELWESDIHELKILAILIRDINKFSPKLADKWVSELYSWDICDQFSMKLIAKTDFCEIKIRDWIIDERTFVRRAGFATMAATAMHQKKWNDEKFSDLLNLSKKYVIDDRNYVWKAVNWAIRQIGKKNLVLREKALNICSDILDKYGDFKSARWIANDAIRELNKPEIIERIKKKTK